MWYKIQIGQFTDNIYLDENGEIKYSKNYLCYTHNGFQYTSFRCATHFLKEHIEYDDRLKLFLNNKSYRLIECSGFNVFPVYHGKVT